jgi:hypothetical protein
MENRDRDKVSRSEKPTDAGDINREVASREGREKHDSGVDFGQKIGESEEFDDPTLRSRIDISGRSEGNH